MPTKILVTFFLLFVHGTAFSYWPEVNECYAIDGPANIRDGVNGDLLTSLDSDHRVNILEVVESGWFKISYSDDPEECGGAFSGWTYKFNLIPLPEDIQELLSDQRVYVTYSDQDKFPRPGIHFDRDLDGIVLFGELQKISIDSGQMVKPSKPLMVLQYCSDGSEIVNELESVFLEYGGDSGSYLPRFKFKKNVLNTCLTVNGSILGIEANSSGNNTNSTSYCDSLIDQGKKGVLNYFEHFYGKERKPNFEKILICDYLNFPFSISGNDFFVTLMNTQLAPSFHTWSLWLKGEQFIIDKVSYP